MKCTRRVPRRGDLSPKIAIASAAATCFVLGEQTRSSESRTRSVIENTHTPNTVLYVNLDESSALYFVLEDPNKGHDHTFFVQHSRDVFAD